MSPALVFIMAQAFNVYSHDQIEAYLEAEDYERALHLTRINLGLYSADQLPILDKLVNQDPHYYYLKLNVCERAYGAGSAEAIRALSQLADWRMAVFEEPHELYILLQRYEREADTEAVQFDLLLGKARIGQTLLEYHIEKPVSEYRVLANDTLFQAADEQTMQILRAYGIARRALDNAAKLVERHPERIDAYNLAVEQVSRLLARQSP